MPGGVTALGARQTGPGVGAAVEARRVGAAGQCYPLAPLHGADPTPRPTPARALEFIIRHPDKIFAIF